MVLVVCAALGLVAARRGETVTGQSGANGPPTSLRSRLAALKMRSDLPAVALSLDFEGYQWLTSPDFGAERAEEPRCVRAEAVTDGSSEIVAVCPSDVVDLIRVGGHPAFELQADDGSGPVLGVGRSVLAPAGPDAAAVNGYLADLARLGLPVPRYRILRLTVNGSAWGLYTLEERWVGEPGPSGPAESEAGSLAVSFNRPVGDELPSLELGSGFARAEVELRWVAGLDLYGGATDRPVDAAQQMDAASEAALRLQAMLQGGQGVGDLIDPERLGQYMALTALWRGSLVPDWRATSLVYEPWSAKFIPVASGLPHDVAMPFPVQLQDDPEIGRAHARALRMYGDSAYLDSVLADTDLEALAIALGDGGWAGLKEDLIRHQASMRDVVAPDSTLRAWYDEDADDLALTLEVTEPFPVEVLGLEFGEQGFLPFDPGWIAAPGAAVTDGHTTSVILPARLTDLPNIVRAVVPKVDLPAVAANEDVDLVVVTRLWGLDERVAVQVFGGSPYEGNDGP